MSRLTVFPPLSVLVPAPVGAMAAAPPPASIREVLDFRRRALDQYASSVVLTTGKALAMSAMAAPAGGQPPASGVEVLAGVGALLIDEELVDRQALEALGAEVFESREIPLILPEPGQVFPAAAAAPWHLASVHVEAARAEGLDGSGILVGVLDTGVDDTHPELGIPVHFQEFAPDGSPVAGGPHDAAEHGTHVCALIAGSTVGVAPAAALAVGAVLTIPTPWGMSGKSEQILAGLNWLMTHDFRGPNADPGVDVINLSLGILGYDRFLYKAIQADRLARGTLTVAAIGNEGNLGAGHTRSPGNYDITLGVGAVNRHDRMWDWPSNGSAWGNIPQHGGLFKPELSAPGEDVVSAVPGGAYQAMSGTSMATPMVTGACALLLQRSPALLNDAAALQAAILGLVRLAPSPRAGRGILDLTGI